MVRNVKAVLAFAWHGLKGSVEKRICKACQDDTWRQGNGF